MTYIWLRSLQYYMSNQNLSLGIILKEYNKSKIGMEHEKSAYEETLHLL